MSPDPLRGVLDDIAGQVRHTDLYEGSLRRSRRIGRRRASALSGAALVVLGLAGFGRINSAPSPAPPPAAVTSLPGFGAAFYRDGAGDLVRLDADGRTTRVVDGEFTSVAVSPDGTRIATVHDGQLRIDGDPVRSGVGVDHAPAWSPDGRRIALGAPGPGILDVAAGTFTPLDDGTSFRWSGDGRRLIRTTTDCRLRVGAVTVPLIGDPATGRNPEGVAACTVTSSDTTGERVTVELSAIGGTVTLGQRSDALVDTRTGEVLAPPVPGRVESMVFGPDGELLVRVRSGAGFTLVVVTAGGRVAARLAEPASLAQMYPVAYTR